MTTKLIENVLNGHLSKDDFGKVYFLNEEAAIDFAEAYHRTKCAESEPVGYAPKEYLDNIDEEMYVLARKTQEGIYDTPVFTKPQSMCAETEPVAPAEQKRDSGSIHKQDECTIVQIAA